MLAKLLCDISSNRPKLREIAAVARNFAKPQAAENIAKVCLQTCFEKSNDRVDLAKDF